MRRVLLITLLLGVHTCSEDSDQERAKRTSQDQPTHGNDNVTAYLAAQKEDRNLPHNFDAKDVNEANASPAIQSPLEGVNQAGPMAQHVFNTSAHDEKNGRNSLRGHVSGSKGLARVLKEPEPVAADMETADQITGSWLSTQPPDRETPDHITGSWLSTQPPDRETPDHITGFGLSAQPPDRETPDHITGSRMSAQPPGDSVDPAPGHALYRRQANPLQKYYEDQKCFCPRCTRPWLGYNHMANVVYGKQAWQSTVYPSSGPPCVVNNGNTNSKMVRTPSVNVNCIHTADADKRPWWLVDLHTEYTINSFKLVRRIDKLTLTQDSRRMVRVVVTINGVVCHTYPDNLDVLVDIYAVKEYACVKPLRGRYVHVQKNEVGDLWYDANLLIFCEIMIYVCLPGMYRTGIQCNKPKSGQPCKYYLDNHYGCTKLVEYNIAMKKTVDMSSVDFGTAESTVDGRTDSRLNKLECTASGTKAGQTFHPFWRVDLDGTHHVTSVVVKPRIDCCVSTMKNLNVLVQNRKVDLASVAEHDPSELCKHWEGVFANGVEQEFKCSRTMLGTFVSLQTILPSMLWLCEVRVMGYPVIVLGPGHACDQNHLTTICQPGLTCENLVCKVPAGKDCGTRERRDQCVSQTICDGGVCKLQLYASCKHQRDLCSLGTECDSDAGYKCQKSLGEQCSTADDCVKKTLGVTCDFLSRCGKKRGVTCAADKECVAGARCDSNRCRCVDGVSTPQGTMCAPVDGLAKANCTVGNCTVNAVCESTNTCQCVGQFEVFRVDFTCSYQKGQVGSACAEDADCGKAMVCQALQCRFDLLGRCKRDYECRAEAVCDDFTELCMLKQWSSCVDTEVKTCMVGTSCYDAVCYKEVGEACNMSNDTCIPTAECGTKAGHSNTLCLLRAGSDCSGDKSTLCREDTTCNADSKCRMPVGGRCGGNSSPFCQLGSQCEHYECRLIYGSDCLNMKKCLKNLICDSLNVCRIPAGSDCSVKQDGCQAGATCSSNVCQCKTTHCMPGPRKVGGACTVPPDFPQDELVNSTAASVETPDNSSNVGQGSCDDRSAVCDRELAVCKCSSGSAPLRSDFKCGTGPGIACNETFKCASNLVCDYSIVCAYHVGERCAGGKAWFCKTGTTCDVDGFCRYYQNEACSDGPTMCRLGTKCDAYTHRCMVPAGSKCANDEECESGSNCRELQCRCAVGVAKPALSGQGCVPEAGRVGGLCLTRGVKCQDKNAACSDAVCKCRQDYIVDPRDFTCKKALGTSCTSDGQCGTHAFCDSDNKCSLQYGEACRGAEQFCPAGAICDSNHECKIKMNGPCRAVDTDNCQSGTSCDWMQKCRLVVGQACNASQACPVGAVCVNNTCGCDPTASKQHNLVCEPLPGRVGSDCDKVDRPCAVPGAECVAETCTCGATSQTTQEFGCLILSKAVGKTEGVSKVGFVVGLSVGVGVVAVLAAAAVYSRERKNLDWVPETRERRQSLAELTKLSHDIDILSAPQTAPSDAASECMDSRSDTSSQPESQYTTTDSQYESGSQYGDQTTLDSQYESQSDLGPQNGR